MESSSLANAGWLRWATAMRDALASHDDDWLVNEMDNPAFWNPFLIRKTKNGSTQVDYDKRDALEKLCFGEFNVAYIRGLAYALVARGDTECLVYRAGTAAEERSECSNWENQSVSLSQVIAGHRVRYYPAPGDRSAWSLPTGPNCHHSIRSV
jgi:hypothetical protein